jgi:hypothetical protein
LEGFTIISSAILVNTTMFLVTDDPSSFPSPSAIASWTANSKDTLQVTDWQLIDGTYAKNILGESGGMYVFHTIAGEMLVIAFISASVVSRGCPRIHLFVRGHCPRTKL